MWLSARLSLEQSKYSGNSIQGYPWDQEKCSLNRGAPLIEVTDTKFYCQLSLNPFTPRRDHFINSLYNNYFNTLSSRKVMRIRKIIN